MLAPPLVAWAILTYNWQSAFVLTGALGLVWVALWLWFYQSPATHPALSASGTRLHPRRAGAVICEGDGTRPSIGEDRRGSGTSGASRCRAFWRIPRGAR